MDKTTLRKRKKDDTHYLISVFNIKLCNQYNVVLVKGYKYTSVK